MNSSPFKLIVVLLSFSFASCEKEQSIGTSICSCGDHVTGRYEWVIPKGEGCNSKNAKNGSYTTFKENERPGVYSVIGTVEFDPKEAQRLCKEMAKP